MHKFDYSEIAGTVPADLAGLIREISELKSLECIREDRYGGELEKVRLEALLSSVTCSNRLEGTIAEAGRIRALVLEKAEPSNRDEERIAGYGDALRRVNSDHNRMGMDSRSIASLHRITMSRGPRMGGGFKPGTEEDIESMTAEYSRARAGGAEPLFLIPCAIFDLLSIAPFQTGNEGVARLLKSVLLLNEGFGVCKLFPMEKRFCAEPGEYHKAFAMSSEGWKENDWTYVPFIRFFLETLLRCYEESDRRFPLDNGRKVKKNDRVLRAVPSDRPASKNEICSGLPDVSRRTVDATLTKLVADGKIMKKGTFRDAKYVRV